uniref:Uncharacterized protein n=1 Tax=Brassica oleracea TaxID=3712 RepID=A0A3P6DTC6_BRAOL|nr:unnamed protein product [Brassica oleracea]
MKSSSTTIIRNLTLNMLGRSCAMTRNGVTFLKPMEALKGGSVRTVHNHQALTQMKPKLLKLINEPIVL